MRYVYFIKAGTHLKYGMAVKIGISNNPHKRLAGLQGANHEPLFLVAAVPGSTEDEILLHYHFREQRIRNNNEWFAARGPLFNVLMALVETPTKEFAVLTVGDILANYSSPNFRFFEQKVPVIEQRSKIKRKLPASPSPLTERIKRDVARASARLKAKGILHC